jgi:mono/diheme cytochrome c family protein
MDAINPTKVGLDLWDSLAGAGSIAGCPAAPAEAASGAMPVTQQNALVQQYCAVCHTDATPTGGLSLEKFDAASPDPGVAAMMVSKLKDGAMSAAGVPQPDRTTLNALISALSAEAAGASGWAVTRTQDQTTRASILTASMVQEARPAASAREPDMYRLTLTCRVSTHEGEMQLAWAPGDVPYAGGEVSVSADGGAPSAYTIYQGQGSVFLSATKLDLGAPKLTVALPAKMLTVSSLFPGETVVFPFGGLTETVRQALSTCFDGPSGR